MNLSRSDYIASLEIINHCYEVLGKDIIRKFDQEGITREEFQTYLIKRVNETKKAIEIENKIIAGVIPL